jgi:hypothetical protein
VGGRGGGGGVGVYGGGNFGGASGAVGGGGGGRGVGAVGSGGAGGSKFGGYGGGPAIAPGGRPQFGGGIARGYQTNVGGLGGQYRDGSRRSGRYGDRGGRHPGKGHHRNKNKNVVGLGFFDGADPWYGYYDDTCYRDVRVRTRSGWRLRRVWVCGPYPYQP